MSQLPPQEDPDAPHAARAAEAPSALLVDRIEYDLGMQDLVRFCRHLARYEPRIQRRLLTGYPLAWMAAALVAFCQALDDWHLRSEAFTTGVLVASLVVSLAYPVFLWLYPILLARRLALRPGFLGEHSVEISEQGIVNSTAVLEGRYDWGRIYPEFPASGDIYLRLQRFHTLIVPARAFRDADQARAWRDWIRGRPPATAGRVDQPAIEAVPISDDAIVLRYTLTEADLRALVRHDLLNNGLRTSVLSVAALGVLGAYVFNGGVFGGVAGVLAGGLLHAYLLPGLRLERWRTVSRLGEAVVLAIQADGIVGWTEEVGGGILTWAGVNRLDRTDEHLFIYYCPGAIVVPLRAFGKPEELAARLKQIQNWRVEGH